MITARDEGYAKRRLGLRMSRVTIFQYGDGVLLFQMFIAEDMSSLEFDVFLLVALSIEWSKRTKQIPIPKDIRQGVRIFLRVTPCRNRGDGAFSRQM